MITVIYHSADFDGIFCREIAKKFLPKDTIFIGWNYGDKIPEITTEELYMMDICIPELMDFPNLIWIDHHKSSIEKFDSPKIKGFRLDGVGACRLAWAYFHDSNPCLESFENCAVMEPLAVRLAGRYDVWKLDFGALELQFGLRAEKQLDWELLLTDLACQPKSAAANEYVDILIESGRKIMQYVDDTQAKYCRSAAFLINWKGLKFLALNTSASNSRAFAALDKKETGHDALIKFNFDGEKWCFSLYHAAHNKEIDLSKIAVEMGGGGHKGACGFICEEFPFNLKEGIKL
jgi:hypothetical protein